MRSKKFRALEGSVAVGLGVRDGLECALATAVVGEAGQELEIALIAAEQDLVQVDEAVDGFLQRRDLARGVSDAVFHLAVVLEERDIVGGGLDAQDAGELFTA